MIAKHWSDASHVRVFWPTQQKDTYIYNLLRQKNRRFYLFGGFECGKDCVDWAVAGQ
jgi:hypothetical protein